MLRKSFVLLSALATSASAVAADLPMRSAPPVFTPVPVYNWSGFYVGANAGVGWANSGNVTVRDPRGRTVGAIKSIRYDGGAGRLDQGLLNLDDIWPACARQDLSAVGYSGGLEFGVATEQLGLKRHVVCLPQRAVPARQSTKLSR
jgi:opacity protein-like surface antigen